MTSSSITVEVSAGELLDKITILEIKRSQLSDPEKLKNVETELAALTAARERSLPPSDEAERLVAELHAVNRRLWDIEDEIRDCERRRDFGARFVELARSVYVTNDRRAEIKRRLNQLFGSRLVEEKSYAAY